MGAAKESEMVKDQYYFGGARENLAQGERRWAAKCLVWGAAWAVAAWLKKAPPSPYFTVTELRRRQYGRAMLPVLEQAAALAPLEEVAEWANCWGLPTPSGTARLDLEEAIRTASASAEAVVPVEWD
jgi:hypothetical protein